MLAAALDFLKGFPGLRSEITPNLCPKLHQVNLKLLVNPYLPTILRKITNINIVSELLVSSYVFSRIYANIATCNPLPFLWVHVVEIFNIAKFAKSWS